jgi:hypothetical protein
MLQERNPSRKSMLKLVKLQSLDRKCCKMRKILNSPMIFANFVLICINTDGKMHHI